MDSTEYFETENIRREAVEGNVISAQSVHGKTETIYRVVLDDESWNYDGTPRSIGTVNGEKLGGHYVLAGFENESTHS